MGFQLRIKEPLQRLHLEWQGCLPVDEVEVLLQVPRVHVALAQFQLSSGVVVYVVHAHFILNTEPTLWTDRPGAVPELPLIITANKLALR